MKALVISNFTLLKLSETRNNVVRIPEVLRRFREFQKELDQGGNSLDLLNFFLSDAFTLESLPKVFSLCRLAVILGLIDRIEKKGGTFQTLILDECVTELIELNNQTQSLAEMISQRMAVTVPHLTAVPSEPELHLVKHPIYQVWSKEESLWKMIFEESNSLSSVIKSVAEQGPVYQFITLGCYHLDLWTDFREFSLEDVQIVDAIEMDPMLQWFLDDSSLRLAHA